MPGVNIPHGPSIAWLPRGPRRTNTRPETSHRHWLRQFIPICPLPTPTPLTSWFSPPPTSFSHTCQWPYWLPHPWNRPAMPPFSSRAGFCFSCCLFFKLLPDFCTAYPLMCFRHQTDSTSMRLPITLFGIATPHPWHFTPPFPAFFSP